MVALQLDGCALGIRIHIACDVDTSAIRIQAKKAGRGRDHVYGGGAGAVEVGVGEVDDDLIATVAMDHGYASLEDAEVVPTGPRQLVVQLAFETTPSR